MTAREAALKAIGNFRRSKTLQAVNIAPTKANTKSAIAERALATQIANGAVQNIAYCDYIVSCFSSIDLKKIQPMVLDILRISTYQLMFLTRVPQSAAVDEAVKLARKYSNPRAASYVNAVLRKIADCIKSGELPEVKGSSEQHRLSIRYSHPQWLVSEFCDLFGIEDTALLLEIHNSSETPVYAQVNKLISDTETVMNSLSSQGILANRHEWLEDCIQLHRPGMLERIDAFREGHFYVQDPASKLAVMASSASPGNFLIDACAAPGGKSFAAAIAMEGKGKILACDLTAGKIKGITNSIARLKIGNIEPVAKDASVSDGELLGKADVVLADVPCSGFGAIRKKPDIRYKEPGDITALADIQRKILSNLSTYVKPSGTLLYSTCTLLPQENEDIISDFLQRHPEFSPGSFTLPKIGEVPGGMLTLLPHVHGTDGFFICKLIRS